MKPEPITYINSIEFDNEMMVEILAYDTNFVDEVKRRVTSGLANFIAEHLNEGEVVMSVTDVVVEEDPYSAWNTSKASQRISMTPLVRCKDCKHKVVNELGWTVCEMESADPYEHTRDVDNDNWFCADGERREDETD